MTLYYAFVFFFALLRKCYSKAYINPNSSTIKGLKHLIKIGLVVMRSFLMMWLPICIQNEESVLAGARDIITRVFPVARGKTTNHNTTHHNQIDLSFIISMINY